MTTSEEYEMLCDTEESEDLEFIQSVIDQFGAMAALDKLMDCFS